MSNLSFRPRRVIGVEEHAWTADLRDALRRFGGDDSVNLMSSQGEMLLSFADRAHLLSGSGTQLGRLFKMAVA